MKLGLILTSRCNASCGHCSTSCGPTRTEALPRHKIFGLMDEAAALSQDEPLKFGISGGEPFLDLELLLEVIAYGKRLGASEVTCVSNAYWATSADKARDLLTQVRRAGLDMLAVSCSRFHLEFVKVKRVERALAAAREVGLPCAVKYVRLQSDPDSAESIEAWGRQLGATRVEIISILPHLRDGVTLPDSDYERRAGLPQGRCPAPIITVRETGEAYTCCTPGALGGFLSLGNTHETSLDEVSDRFYLGGKQQILRTHGPIHFARAAVAQGAGGRLRESYGGVCDLCTHVATDPVLAAIADESVRQFEQERFESILRQAV
jgi:MoaA/NifB/PqqE/SkfB family radical SAM enzyme